MKNKLLNLAKYALSIALFMGLSTVNAQTLPGTLINSWLGNSNAEPVNYMPQGIEGMFVSPDGAVYSNVPWEEGGRAYTEVKDGIVNHGAESLGWGAIGGSDVTANSKYVFFTTAKGNEGGALTGSDYPPKGFGWSGVLRCLKANIKQAAPFVGGKGTGGMPNSMLVVFELGENVRANITGVYATETELFVASDYDDKIRVYDANTMAYIREWTVKDPFQLFMDKQGMLWVASGFESTKIVRYSITGTKQAQEINLAAGSKAGDFCIDKDNRMLVGDVGQREQVLIYTNINASPEMTATFGDQFGIFSGVTGKMAPLKFHQVRGIGTDDAGNIYIGNTQWYTGGQGYILESYTVAGSLSWSRYCTMFVDRCGSDPASDAADIYGTVEHFKVDYTKPAGQEATLAAFTANRYKYPNDPRFKSQASTADMRTYNGKKFLVTIPQAGGMPLTIYRFNASTDGEVAIPCVMWGNNKGFPNAPVGTWLWRDLNANGQMDNGEFITLTEFGAYSSNIDKDMTVWLADSDIRSFACIGLDANGIPMYSPTFNKVSKPIPFIDVRRTRYVPETDVMYLGGTTKDHFELNYWGNMGSVIRRYNNWSKGNRNSLYEIVLPSDVKSGPCTQSFDVAGDYVFTSISVGRAPFLPGEIKVFKGSDGSAVGKMVPPSSWSVGWNDMVECLNVTKKTNGEYVVIQEEDGRNKNVMLRWCPTGDCINSQCTNLVDSVNIAPETITLIGIDTALLVAEVYPDTVCDKNVGWTSTDESIVKVDFTGKITSVNAGSAWVKAISVFPSEKVDSCLIIVLNVPLTGIKVDTDSLSLGISRTHTLAVSFLPENAISRKLTWISSAHDIATVDSVGQITAIGNGEAFIIATSLEGNFSDTCVVAVRSVRVSNIVLANDTIEIWNGTNFRLKYTIYPADAINKKVIWNSLNESIASVDDNGNIKGGNLGVTGIVVKTDDGNNADTCFVKVLSASQYGSMDIGNPCAKGSYSESNGSIKMVAGGTDMFGSKDQFHYVCKPWKGDGQIKVRLTSLVSTDAWTKAGVMIRESLDPGSKNVYSVFAPEFGASIQWRDTTDRSTYYYCEFKKLNLPYWAKLVRVGKNISAYKSVDGNSWSKVGDCIVSMTDSVYIGLCLCAHTYKDNGCTPTTAEFDNLSITSTIDGINSVYGDNKLNNDIKIWPNPLAGGEEMKISGLGEGKGFISIISLDGKILYTNEFKSSTASIRNLKLKPGVYILRIQKSEGVESKRIIVK